MKMKNSFTQEELHSFLTGLFETLCPWPSRYKLKEKEAEYTPYREFHYYLGGRGVGFILLLLILVGIAKLIVGGVL